jgi:endonuclease YncB( thermonuclease family)
MRNLMLGLIWARVLYLVVAWALWEPRPGVRLSEDLAYELIPPAEGLELVVRPAVRTAMCDGQETARIRLLGIDLPATPVRDEHAPQRQVADRLNQLLSQGRLRVQLDRRQSTAQGSWLAYLFTEQQHVNRLLVEEGLAVVNSMPCDCPAIVRELQRAQRQAQVQGLGCWRTED